MNNNISTLSFLLLLFPFLFIYFKMGSAREPQFHVLAVDDSLIDRKLIERLLKTSSYQVTTVDSGNKALEFLGLQNDQPSVSPHNHQEIKVNLIITDYCMPGMTGYDLLKKVKESSLFRNVPVVIMSSENVPSRITRCLEDGAEEFFLKPVMLSDVNKLRPVMLRAKYGQQQQRAQRSDNRRKSIEDGISPERTRLRYNGVATGLIVLLIWFLLFFGSSLSESEPGFFRNFLPFKSLLSNVLHDGEHTSR